MDESVDEDPTEIYEESQLEGMIKRLACLLAAVGVVVFFGLIAPAWVALTILVAIFLPMLVYRAVFGLVGILVFVVGCSCGLRKSWPITRRVLPVVIVGIVEEHILAITAALLLVWLLR
jgi:hypothetical protein